MHVFEMVVWIVAISCIAGVVTTWMKGRQHANSRLSHVMEDRLDRLEELEDRVAVLEKIVTDDKGDLKRRIDEL